MLNQLSKQASSWRWLIPWRHTYTIQNLRLQMSQNQNTHDNQSQPSRHSQANNFFSLLNFKVLINFKHFKYASVDLLTHGTYLSWKNYLLIWNSNLAGCPIFLFAKPGNPISDTHKMDRMCAPWMCLTVYVESGIFCCCCQYIVNFFFCGKYSREVSSALQRSWL